VSLLMLTAGLGYLDGTGLFAPENWSGLPAQRPGRLTELSSSPTGVDLTLAGDGTGVLDGWIPGAGRPPCDWTGLSGVTIAAKPGGWRLTAHAAGGYTLKARHHRATCGRAR
jgi:hypothetical protein